MAEQYDITNTKTGQVITVTGDAPPSPEDIEEIFAQQALSTPVEGLGQVPMLQAPTVQPLPETPGIGMLAMETVAGFNRPLAWLADRTFMTPINIVRQFQNKPFISVEQMVGEKGQYAGEGILVDAAAAAGELASMGLGTGTVLRGVTSLIDDAARLSTETLPRVLAQLGRSRPSQDVAAGLASGAGGEFTAEFAEQVLGENAEASARLVGQVFSPLVLTTTANTIINSGKNILNISLNKMLAQNTPSGPALKGASRALYGILEEANIVANTQSKDYLVKSINNFKVKEEINKELFPDVDRISNYILGKAGRGDVTWSYLDRAKSLLGRYSTGNNAEAAAASKLAEVIDDAILNLTPLNPSALGDDTVKSIITNARQFWRRGKTVDIMTDIFETARIQTIDGSEDFGVAIRKGLKKFLAPSNKKKQSSFSSAELKQIESVVRGTSAQRAFETFNLFGGANSKDWYKQVMFTATAGVVGGVVGSGGSGATAGVTLAATFTAAKLAQVAANAAMRRNANLMRSVISAGSDGLAVTRAYLAGTPRSLRKPAELSALLLANRADLSALRNTALGKSPIVSDALFLTILGNGAIKEEQQQEQPQQ